MGRLGAPSNRPDIGQNVNLVKLTLRRYGLSRSQQPVQEARLDSNSSLSQEETLD